MHELSRDDLAEALEVVSSVNQAGNRDTFFRDALAAVVRVVRCAVASINEVDPVSGRFNYWMEPASFPLPERAAEIFAGLAPTHPMLRLYEDTGDGSAHRISDIWTTEEFHASRLYQDFYRLMDIEFQISFTFPAPRPTVLAMALSRTDEDFSERDKAMLDAVRPHLSQAWRTAGDRERLQALAGAATSAVGEQGWTVILLSDPPEEMTPGALAILERYFGPPRAGQFFPEPVQQWLAAMAEPVPTGSPIEIRRPLDASLDGRRAVLRYLAPQQSHPGAIVIREEPRLEQRQRLESLALTAREAEIVRLVTLGEPNASIARKLNISPGTVKKHLDNVYEKLGVHGRGPLTAFVLDIV